MLAVQNEGKHLHLSKSPPLMCALRPLSAVGSSSYLGCVFTLFGLSQMGSDPLKCEAKRCSQHNLKYKRI